MNPPAVVRYAGYLVVAEGLAGGELVEDRRLVDALADGTA